MPKAPRTNAGDVVYHVINRGNARLRIFDTDGDYRAFLRIMAEAHEQVPMRLLAYCIMPNHWHLVLWPYHNGDISKFMHWVTMTHAHRWQAVRQAVGTGHLYGGRFRNFAVENDRHYLTVCRYVERNPLRAGLAARAEEWPWCSLFQRRAGTLKGLPPLAEGPMPFPEEWIEMVNLEQDPNEVETIHRCIHREVPFGNEPWVERVARQTGIELHPRARGRPRKK